MSSLKGLEYEARVHGAAIQTHVNSLLASSGSGTETSAAPASASAQSGGGGGGGGGSKAKAHIASAKNHIDDAMRGGGGGGEGGASMEPRVKRLEAENARMTAELKELRGLVEALSAKLAGTGLSNGPAKAAAPAPAKKAEESEEDSDPDLFGSDSEEEDDEEKAARKAKLLEAYAAKKAKKPGPIAKSSIIFDCKPWEAETDMAAMEASVRGVSMEGLIWGAAKLIPVAYGVKKLQIMATVEDEKVSVDELQERIEAFEDYVQSVDIAAFNKI